MTAVKAPKVRPAEQVLARLAVLGLQPHTYVPHLSDLTNGRMAQCCTQPAWNDVHRDDVVLAYQATVAARKAAAAAAPDITEPRYPRDQLTFDGETD